VFVFWRSSIELSLEYGGKNNKNRLAKKRFPISPRAELNLPPKCSYRIRSIRRHGYYTCQFSTGGDHYSRAAFIGNIDLSLWGWIGKDRELNGSGPIIHVDQKNERSDYNSKLRDWLMNGKKGRKLAIIKYCFVWIRFITVFFHVQVSERILVSTGSTG